MPTYLYLCEQHGEFEQEHSIKIKLEVCPKCQEENINPPLPVTRLINNCTIGVVELTGQDLVDKVKSDAQNLKKEMSKSTNTYANMLGESRYHQLQTKLDRRGK